MIEQGLIDSPVFSFRIGSSEDDGGEAVFGGIDPSAYTGEIDYVPVRRKAYWEVEIQKILFGDDELELENTGGAIDTGLLSSSVRFRQLLILSKALPSLFYLLTSPKCSTLRLVPRKVGMVNTKLIARKSPAFQT